MPFVDEAAGRIIDQTIGGEFDMLLGRRTYEIFSAYWPHQGDIAIGALGATIGADRRWRPHPGVAARSRGPIRVRPRRRAGRRRGKASSSLGRPRSNAIRRQPNDVGRSLGLGQK
jgi:hypothetical protein